MMYIVHFLMDVLHSVWAWLSSESGDHFMSALSSVVTIVVAVIGVFFAREWLDKRNRERAHDAADRFFDALIDLPLVQWQFLMDAARCMALLSSAVDSRGDELQQHNQQAIRQCMNISEEANSIKLRFQGHYAKASRRGARVIQESHQDVERALISFCHTASLLFKDIAVRLIVVKDREGYLNAVRDFQKGYDLLHVLSTSVNDAVRATIEVPFSDYFIFPEMTVVRQEGQ